MRRTSRLVLLLGIFLAALTFVVVILIRPGGGGGSATPSASAPPQILPTVVAALKGFYSILTVVFFVPVVAGVYSSRVGPAEALAGIGAGVCAMLAVHLLTGGHGVGGMAARSHLIAPSLTG